MIPGSTEFAGWAKRWMDLAHYTGPRVPGVSYRIDQLIRLWQAPIPEPWQRGSDSQLLRGRYRRGDLKRPHPGEHTIEYEILCRHFDHISCYGGILVDGVNALPLTRDVGGGRRANVEADMYLLAKREGAYEAFLCEVKVKRDNAWFAAIESLRQLRLLISNPESLGLFARRNPSLHLPPYISVTALVLAPPDFYSSPGKKGNACGAALDLITQFRSEFNLDIRLAEWDSKSTRIDSVKF